MSWSLCDCSKLGPGFPTSHVMVFMLSISSVNIRDNCFVAIGGIVDHHCLNFLFIINFYCIVHINILPMLRYSWNNAKVGVKHQSINQSIYYPFHICSLYSCGIPILIKAFNSEDLTNVLWAKLTIKFSHFNLKDWITSASWI